MSENLDTWARYVGEDCPGTPWLLHPCDVWVANPHYVGPPRPHPEDDDDECYADAYESNEDRGTPWREVADALQCRWDEADDLRF